MDSARLEKVEGGKVDFFGGFIVAVIVGNTESIAVLIDIDNLH